MTVRLPRPLAVVAHDAGAANIIFSWLARDGLAGVRAALAGPAAEIWARRFHAVPFAADPEAVLDGAEALLSGTGWSSTLEHEARKQARLRGLTNVAVIDHWVNYRERFRRGGEEILPDELWVTDAYALAQARSTLPEVPVREQPNLYLSEQVAAAGPRPVNGDLLFVAEPARSDWGGDRAGEFQALDYLAAHRAAAGIGGEVPLRIRPHPSDSPDKYDGWIAAHPGSGLDRSTDMAGALTEARWVAGLQSFALIIALEAGRPAICVLPPGAPACALPHTNLVHLRELVESAA